MAHESHGNDVIDEIDRLLVAYDKAKQYVSEVSAGIEQQINTWQNRRQIVIDQQTQLKASSFEFLLPKTQRINELTLEAVSTLCRVSVLFEQISRIEPKPLSQSHAPRMLSSSTSFSARSLDPVIPNPMTNTMTPRFRHPAPSPSLNSTNQGKSYGQQTQPMPVLRTTQQHQQSQSPASRSTLITPQEKTGFKPIEQQLISNAPGNTPRPTPIHPQQNNLYPATEGLAFPPRLATSSQGSISSPSERGHSPSAVNATHMASVNQQHVDHSSQEKVKLKLQRIVPTTVWKEAKIDVIDSLSAFYLENLDTKVQEKFRQMLQNLHNHYQHLEETGGLIPLNNVAIGDYCVAKYKDDDCWYRARILMCEENNRMRIVFVDYGNIEIKSIDEFFPLDPRFAYLPAQAIACTLSGAYPHSSSNSGMLWPTDTIRVFKDLVSRKPVEVQFVVPGEGTDQWPLHFVQIIVDNQSVTGMLDLKQHIEPKPNRFIAEQLAPSITHQEFILFNVPLSDDEVEI